MSESKAEGGSSENCIPNTSLPSNADKICSVCGTRIYGRCGFFEERGGERKYLCKIHTTKVMMYISILRNKSEQFGQVKATESTFRNRVCLIEKMSRMMPLESIVAISLRGGYMQRRVLYLIGEYLSKYDRSKLKAVEWKDGTAYILLPSQLREMEGDIIKLMGQESEPADITGVADETSARGELPEIMR